MKTLILTVTILTFAISFHALAGVISDDFNDASLDLTKWTPWSSSPNDWWIEEYDNSAPGTSGLMGYNGGYLRSMPNVPGNEFGNNRAAGIRTNLAVDLTAGPVTVVYEGFEQYDSFGFAMAGDPNLANAFLFDGPEPYVAFHGVNTGYQHAWSNTNGQYAVSNNWADLANGQKPYGTARMTFAFTPLGGGIYQIEHSIEVNSSNLAEDLLFTKVLSPNSRGDYTTVAIPDADAQSMYLYFFLRDYINYAPLGQDTRLDSIVITGTIVPEPSLLMLFSLLFGVRMLKRK